MVATAIYSGATLDEAVEELRFRFRGEVICPGDEGYESGRHVWNGSFDRRPALIVRPADEVDVINAVRFARERGLTPAVRGGGHSVAGHSTCDGGIVVDLSAMNSVRIDPERRIARVQAGATWGEYAEQAQVYGLATSSGDTASVGVGGLTLGGGIGWMVRKQGLAIDNLLSVEVVTADGRLLRASVDENPDLFWALRGGGGNFGIATSFEFRLHPAGMVLGGAVFYPADDAAGILRAFADYAVDAPDELTAMALVVPQPPLPFLPAETVGRLVVAIAVCYTGDLVEGERVVASLRALGAPIGDVIMPMPYPAIFQLTEHVTVKGKQFAGQATYLDSLQDDVIDTIVTHSRRMTAPEALVQIRMLGGAMARVPQEATAFGYREKPFLLLIASQWEDPADADREQAWTEEFWNAIRSRGAGVYVNFVGDEGQDRVREAYKPATYERLAAVKRRYDPTNLFSLNQNIRPA